MAVPLFARSVAAVIGGLLVLVVWISVIGTLMVPRPVGRRLTYWAAWLVRGAFRLAAGRADGYLGRDRMLAWQAPVALLAQLGTWLGIALAGFCLLMWPLVSGIGEAFTVAGSSMFTLGFAEPKAAPPSVVVFAAAVTGLAIVTLQIAYLPTLYAAFNRRETEVVLLNARSGTPSWGPELLARTHYALGTGVSTLDTLPDLYERWERWAADVAESHTTYLPLVRFRSPRPLSSWVTALLAVLDSAALFLALSPGSAPVVPARLCREIAQALGFEVPDEPDPSARTSLSYQEFLHAVERLRAADFPIERDPAEAWPDFVGWRASYEQAAYAVAAEVDAVPALWSGPRRLGGPANVPARPPAAIRLQRLSRGHPAASPDRQPRANHRVCDAPTRADVRLGECSCGGRGPPGQLRSRSVWGR
jgi:hypothetical protein